MKNSFKRRPQKLYPVPYGTQDLFVLGSVKGKKPELRRINEIQKYKTVDKTWYPTDHGFHRKQGIGHSGRLSVI